MGEYNFKEDLSLGKYGENVVINDLVSLGAELVDTCDMNYYDFRIKYKDKIICYEVKTDDYCKIGNDTGNLFVEFECRGKESGISVTMSDWFVYYYLHLGEIWYIRTNKLKDLIDNNNFRVSKNSGDSGSNTKGYLINRYQFEKKFMIHKVKRPSWDIYNKINS